MRNRHISMVHKVDTYNFVDVTNRYGLEISYTDNVYEIVSNEPIFSSISTIFQTDNTFTVVIRYMCNTFYVSCNKFNTIQYSELVLVLSVSEHSIKFSTESIPYI